LAKHSNRVRFRLSLRVSRVRALWHAGGMPNIWPKIPTFSSFFILMMVMTQCSVHDGEPNKDHFLSRRIAATLHMFLNTGNSYKFQAGSRALAVDWCRHIKQASESHLPKVHFPFSQIASGNVTDDIFYR